MCCCLEETHGKEFPPPELIVNICVKRGLFPGLRVYCHSIARSHIAVVTRIAQGRNTAPARAWGLLSAASFSIVRAAIAAAGDGEQGARSEADETIAAVRKRARCPGDCRTGDIGVFALRANAAAQTVASAYFLFARKTRGRHRQVLHGGLSKWFADVRFRRRDGSQRRSAFSCDDINLPSCASRAVIPPR